MYRFNCHHCGKKLSYRMDQLGRKIRCPRCEGVLHCGMQERSTEAADTTPRFQLGDRKQLIMASGLLVVAIVMIWYSFFS